MMAAMSEIAAARPAPTDALTTAFAELVRLENTNTNQIVIVEGALCAHRLAAAVHRAAQVFPLLRASHGAAAWRQPEAGSLGVSLHDWKGACDFHDPAFRAMLMALSRSNRLDCSRRAACQVYLVHARDRSSSCVYLTSAHAVADARSDCMLLARIMREYASPGEPAHADADHGFATLQEIVPDWYTRSARWRRAVPAQWSIAQDVFRRDGGLHRRRSNDVPSQFVDFSHSIADDETVTAIAGSARKAGVTFNTLFLAALVRLLERNTFGRTTRVTCALSLRNSLPPRYGDSFRNYLIPIAVRSPRNLGTQALLRHLQSTMLAARQPAGLQMGLGRLECLAQSVARPWLDPLTRFFIARSQGTNACLSNPGVIAEDLSGFGPDHAVRQYTGFGCLLEPYDFILYPPTVNGRLQFDVVYRRAAFRDIETELMGPYRAELAHLLNDVAHDGSEGASR